MELPSCDQGVGGKKLPEMTAGTIPSEVAHDNSSNTCNELESKKDGLLNRVEEELVRPVLRWARPSRHVRFAGSTSGIEASSMEGEPISGNSSSLFSDRGGCRSKSVPSNGAADRAS